MDTDTHGFGPYPCSSVLLSIKVFAACANFLYAGKNCEDVLGNSERLFNRRAAKNLERRSRNRDVERKAWRRDVGSVSGTGRGVREGNKKRRDAKNAEQRSRSRGTELTTDDTDEHGFLLSVQSVQSVVGKSSQRASKLDYCSTEIPSVGLLCALRVSAFSLPPRKPPRPPEAVPTPLHHALTLPCPP